MTRKSVPYTLQDHNCKSDFSEDPPPRKQRDSYLRDRQPDLYNFKDRLSDSYVKERQSDSYVKDRQINYHLDNNRLSNDVDFEDRQVNDALKNSKPFSYTKQGESLKAVQIIKCILNSRIEQEPIFHEYLAT